MSSRSIPQREPCAAAEHLMALRAELAAHGLSGVIVPRFDGHQGEYCADHDNRLAFLTGFTGSAGMAIVKVDRAAIFVDGRYQVQVRNEVDTKAYAVEHLFDAPPESWLRGNVFAGERIGFNPILIPPSWHRRFDQAVTDAGGTLVPLEADLIDAIWPDQPDKPLGRIEAFPVSAAGEASAGKRARIAALVAEAGADFLVEAQPDNIAWLLNVRGSDVAFNPMPHSYLILDRSGGVEWFIDQRKLPNALEHFEMEGIERRDVDHLLQCIARRAAGQTVFLDPDFAPAAAGFAVEQNGGTLCLQRSPVTLSKAVKNPVELDGFRQCHVEDGAALSSFLAWLAAIVGPREASGEPVSELEAEQKLLGFRQGHIGFVTPSFRTISAFGANASMCHYAATPTSNAPITSHGLYLIDSGGQYRTGTTDVTRTVAFGAVDEKTRLAYTAVLKGLVAMLLLRFPARTQGHQIDAFARKALWDIGLDYDHGTGHGVGHFLSVHEHPQRLAKVFNPVDLVEGMVMTVEPGYYASGQYGIRIENQVEIIRNADGFLCFDSLTLAPIDLSLALIDRLTPTEIRFIDTYHARVRGVLESRVDESTRRWLIHNTRPVDLR